VPAPIFELSGEIQSVELDRHFIERNDFSAARRGYDPEEVDRHLREIAESVQELKRQAKRSPTSMAAQAAEQVRGIVEAAERSAQEITDGAESEARKIVEEANERARETREKADRDALDRVQAAEDATQSVLDRSNGVKSEIDRMLDDARAAADTLASNLRSSASSLQGELDSIRGEISTVREGRLEAETRAGGGSRTAAAMSSQPASVEPEEIDATADEEPEAVIEVEETVVEVGANGDGASAVDEDEETAEEEGAEAAEEASAPQSSSGSGRSIRGAEGARLIALNMALNGTPRDETARYLSQNFDLDDQDALLDEVYARVGD
jgi:DivIVA domain-containing protein